MEKPWSYYCNATLKHIYLLFIQRVLSFLIAHNHHF